MASASIEVCPLAGRPQRQFGGETNDRDRSGRTQAVGSCDGGAPGQQGWTAVLADHGSELVTGIKVTTGFTGGDTLSALLRSLKVNGTDYVFGAA